MTVTYGQGIRQAVIPYCRPIKHAGQLAFAGCVIRLDPHPHHHRAIPYVHANASHINLGVTACYVDAGDIVCEVANEGLPIVTCGVWMDETTGGMHGVTGGISGGGAISKIRLNKDGNRIWVNGTGGGDIAGPVSNLWVSWTYYTGN